MHQNLQYYHYNLEDHQFSINLKSLTMCAPLTQDHEDYMTVHEVGVFHSV